jgi:hypothetical protein
LPVLGRSQPSNWRLAGLAGERGGDALEFGEIDPRAQEFLPELKFWQTAQRRFLVTRDSVSDVVDTLQSDVIGGAAVGVKDRDCSVITLRER